MVPSRSKIHYRTWSGSGIIGTYNNGPDCTVDEATFSSVPVPQTGSPQVIITKSQTQIILILVIC